MPRRQEKKRRIIVVYHAYKAGGTTIIHGLKRQYGTSSLIEVDKHAAYAQEKAYNIDFFERIVPKHPDVIAFTAHRVVPNIHFSRELDVFPITFVRHPLLRAMSVYRFERIRQDEWQRKKFALKYKFSDWVLWCLDSGVECRNFQSCLLSLDDEGRVIGDSTDGIRRGNLDIVLKRLEAMPAVGVVERFSESLQSINRAGQHLFPGLAIPDAQVNSTKVVHDWQDELTNIEGEMSENARSRFYAANDEDLVLFEKYCSKLMRRTN